ncbi:protein FAR1-RELATED SEQUENCE 5-like isoform X1 [Aristolochia californica]|uniref:protein FAR1-RELATED SEQUENCE 5-like isoform X1 n=1 Tax=Aristolochia californica TaxID=171875 RepID=UPI0035DCE4E2
MDGNPNEEDALTECHIPPQVDPTRCHVPLSVGHMAVTHHDGGGNSGGPLLHNDPNEYCIAPDIEPHFAIKNGDMIGSSGGTVIEPYEGMEFESEEAARVFYNEYAIQAGFGSRVSRNRRSRKDGENIARNFVCSKEGYRANRQGNTGGRSRRQRAVTREGCGAMITVKKTNTGKWAVTKFVKEHNHPLLSPSEARALRSHKVASESKKLCAKSRTDGDYGMMVAREELGNVEINGNMEPYEGMELESEEAARIFYSTYARRTGFRSRISKNRRSRKDGEVIARKFVCCKEGFRAKQHENKKERIYRPRAITRLGCEAMVMVKKQSNGQWVVAKFVKEHNHALLDPSKMRCIRTHSNASDASKKLLEGSEEEKMGKNETSMVSGGNERQINNLDTPEEGIGNHNGTVRKRKRSPERSTQSILDYLKRMQSENPAFFYATQQDEDESLCCIFWADARSRLAYNYFGDVVCFDTRFKTENYEIPFASFTGLNHHQQPILFGCVLLFKEIESSFVWLFRTWLEAMSGRHPVTMVTNQDEGIEAAIAQVFPKTHHCFCTWEILNEVPKQLSHVNRTFPLFQEEFQKCISLSETIYEFESAWKSIISKYKLKDNEWLHSLYNARQRWVPIYLRDTFFAHFPTSQRSETINSFFNDFLNASTTLQDFIMHYERALTSRFEKELEEDVQTVRVKPMLKSRLPIEKQMADIYTRAVFLQFQEEIYESLGYVANKIKEAGTIHTYSVSSYEEQRRSCTVIFNVPEKRVSCSCLMFEFSGILCRHALIVLTASDIISVPPYYILERWTRNAKSGVGLDRRSVAMQTNCRKSYSLRYSDLCKQAIRCAEAGASSVQDYDVAVRALREAWDKIVGSRKKVSRVLQVETQASGSSQGDDFIQSEVDNTPNSISFCDPQQSKARGRPRNSSSKLGVEKTAKSVKCSLCKEHDHDKSLCPRLRPIGGSFGTGGGLMLDPGPSDLRGHSMLGADQSGFSDGILCLSLGDHFDTHGTPGLPSFGPNSYFQMTNITNPRLFNVNEEFSMTRTRTSPGP